MWRICPQSIRTPIGQSVILGTIFLFIFTAYMTIQGYASQLYGSELGSNMEMVLYGVFTGACFVAPPITNMLGSRLTLFVGSLGYACLVGASLLLAIEAEVVGTNGTDIGNHTAGPPAAAQHVWCQVVVVIGGAMCGLGAALLWTAQGRLMLEWSADGSDQGRLFSVFWGLFNCSAVAGGLLTYFYFSHNTEDAPWPLYLVFLACIIAGGAATGLLAPSSEIVFSQRPSKTSPSSAMDAAALPPPAPLRSEQQQHQTMTTPPTPTWIAEATATIRLFSTRRMATLSLLFWYTGFNQPYQLNTFGDRYFDKSTLGLELALFYGAEVVGGFLVGWLLDREASARVGAMRQLAIFIAVTLAGYTFSLVDELPVAMGKQNATQLSIADGAVVAPSAAFFLWGLSDSQVQGYAYWLIRQCHDDGPDMARAVGFYKMVQSLGWCVGFAMSPPTRVPPIVQNLLTLAMAVFGALLALLELPPRTPPSLTKPLLAEPCNTAMAADQHGAVGSRSSSSVGGAVP